MPDSRKRRAEAPRAAPRRSALTTAAVCIAVLAAGFAGYRRAYPSEQRCPPPTDRFNDHCMEGRKHFVIEIDWDCIGPQNAAHMRQALSLPEKTRMRGVGRVPSWLTDESAAGVRALTKTKVGPCIRDFVLDLACNYCVPEPRKNYTKDESKDEGAAAEGAEAKTKATAESD